MNKIKQSWNYFFFAPFNCVFRCFFQPIDFQKEVDVLDALPRALLLVRVSFLVFLLCYPLALMGRIALFQILHIPLLLQVSVWTIAFCVLAGVVWGTIWGFIGRFANGVVCSITAGIAWGIASTTIGGIDGGLVGAIVGGSIGGVSGSITGVSRGNLEWGLIGGVIAGIVGGFAGIFVGGIIGGIIGGLVGAIFAFVPMIVTRPDSVSILGLILIMGVLLLYVSFKTNSRWIICLAFFSGYGAGILGSIMWYYAANEHRKENVLEHALKPLLIALAGSVVVGLVKGILSHDKNTIILGVMSTFLLILLTGMASFIGISAILSITFSAALIIIIDIQFGTVWAATLGIILILSYAVGHYRLLLYPLSSLSMRRCYNNSQVNPQKVFVNLHNSSLYWDECVFLPLPYLKDVLLVAAGLNVGQVLKEIDFILHKRVQQKIYVQFILQEIALRHLETREGLREIATVSQYLSQIFSREMRLIEASWNAPFIHFEEASQDAANYYSQNDWRAKDHILKQFLTNIEKVHSDEFFSDTGQSNRLAQVVHTWRTLATHEQENLKNTNKNTPWLIENPYQPGQPLQLHDSLFVGRHDIAQKLVEALKSNKRPTFFLNGERRMGKTSIIKQLPAFLGSMYIPIFYDLQSLGATSSAPAFLALIAEEIQEELSLKRAKIKKLEYEHLQQANKENESEAYYLFGRWMKDVELLLKQENKILLLAFDEFEQLTIAEQRNYLDLNLLLNWFRSTVQNSVNIALLFSGVKTVDEMGDTWPGYFVNVENLHVSFLRHQEAKQLITNPVLGALQEHPFNEQVVAEIMHLTRCHPFLIHTVCSELVTYLNSKKCTHAEIQDVKIVKDQVLEKWNSYFWDLWQRADFNQHKCLTVINNLGKSNFEKILQKTDLGEKEVHHALRISLKHDLVQQEKNCYEIAVPLFSEWITRNSLSA